MGLIRIFLFLLSSLLLISNSYAALPEVKQLVGKSSISAYVIEDHYLPIVSIRLAFLNSGKAYDKGSKEGIATMVSSLLDEGAGDLPATEYRKRLEELAATISFDSDNDNFYVSIETLKENYAETLKLVMLCLTKPRFDKDAVDRIRNQIKIVLQKKKEDPEYIAFEEMKKYLYGNHPYARSGFGTNQTLDSITINDLKQYVQDSFAKDNLKVSIVGDVNKSDVMMLLDEYLAKLPQKQKSVVKLENPKINNEPMKKYIPMDIPQTVIVFARKGVMRQDKDFYEAYILNHILGGGGFESRLVDSIREKRGLAYSITSFLEMEHKSGTFNGIAGVASKNTDKSVGLIENEIKQIANKGVTAEELNDAKQYLVGSFPLKMTKNSSLSSFLNVMQTENLGIDFLKIRNDMINKLKLEDVNNVSKKLFGNDDLAFVIVGKRN